MAGHTYARYQRRPNWAWRIVATLIAGPVVAVAIGVYAELADAPITTNHYTDDGVRIVYVKESP